MPSDHNRMNITECIFFLSTCIVHYLHKYNIANDNFTLTLMLNSETLLLFPYIHRKPEDLINICIHIPSNSNNILL